MRASNDPKAAESVYVINGDLSPDAITSSLQALLPSRRHPIARHRFTVLDTFDGRVRRAGARLTEAGTRGASTMAWRPRGGRGQLSVRLAQPVNFAWDLPNGPFRQALAPVVGVRRLLAQADAEEHGSRVDILDDRGKTVARLEIEAGHVRPPGPRRAWQPLPTVVTLTGLRGFEDVYRRLVPVIESRPGITLCPEGFNGVVLRQLGKPALEDATSPRVDVAPTVRADVGARLIHKTLVGILLANEAGLRANLDTEFLHDYRVAVRRTRALLGQIRGVFAPSAVEHFSTEFSWMGRLTGPPRDLDVLVLALRGQSADVPSDDMESLLAFLGQAQQEEHRRLVNALDGNRYRRLVSEWKRFLERPASSEPGAEDAGRPLADVISRRAWHLSQRIARSAETIDERTAPARLHEVRIDAKKLRYLIDVTPAFYDAADLECVLGALKKLQRVLGDFNDAEVQEKRLIECGRALGAASGPAGAVLALGRLAEQSRERRERLRGEAIDKLADFGDHDTRSACRRAFKRAGRAEGAR